MAQEKNGGSRVTIRLSPYETRLLSELRGDGRPTTTAVLVAALKHLHAHHEALARPAATPSGAPDQEAA